MEMWTKKTRSKKNRRNHIDGSWQTLVLIFQAKVTADLLKLKSVSGNKKQKQEIKELHRKQNNRGGVPVYTYKVHTNKYTIQLHTHGLNVCLLYSVHLLQMCAKIYICYVCRQICCFIYKYTKSFLLSTMKYYDDIPKLPLKMQRNNAINIRNGNWALHSIITPNSTLDTTTQHHENKKQPKHACSEADRRKDQILKILIKIMLPNLKFRTRLQFWFGIFSSLLFLSWKTYRKTVWGQYV